MTSRQHIDSLFEALGLRLYVIVEFRGGAEKYPALVSRVTYLAPRSSLSLKRKKSDTWRLTLFTEDKDGILHGMIHVEFPLKGVPTFEEFEHEFEASIGRDLWEILESVTGEMIDNVRLEP